MKFFLFVTGIALSGSVFASTGESWNESYKKVVETCVKESKLVQAKAVGKLYVFSDSAGYVLEVEGLADVKKKSPKVKLMCLTSRDFKTTEIQEGIAPNAKGEFKY
jgi:hypothetical protein